MKDTHTPLVYSCSGCSQVAQLANRIAVHLDRSHMAEMSCIAGIGGQVKPIIRLAQSGRPILAIDGCPLRCVQRSLNSIQVAENHHLLLSDYGLKKRQDEEYGEDVLLDLVSHIEKEIIPAMHS